MKHILTNASHEVLRFDLGDDVLTGLLEFSAREGIDAGWISALGAAKEVELGYYEVKSKEYRKKIYNEFLEIATITGNIGRMNNKPVIHMHGSFGTRDYATVSGHVHRLIAGATVEVFIHKIAWALNRAPDLTSGLNLLK